MARLPHITTVLAVVALSSSSIVKSPADDGQNFELLILHNNDMHARFEQTSQLSGACTTADREAGKCYGGFPRVAHVVKEARKAAASGEGPPVLYLNAGDTYTGTAWFTVYKWKVAAEFLNALQPDAVNGIEDPYVKALKLMVKVLFMVETRYETIYYGVIYVMSLPILLHMTLRTYAFAMLACVVLVYTKSDTKYRSVFPQDIQSIA
ncbi:jg7347 [Pararge aegeria aegeria]|uniref:5'-nucleotidase n=1 Tax=Pararge aegeria aegeria TaxID=348720 RepID=A0A8S4REZ7_9NEOP|nr:jg7347 [Pararge aegeria aegeria]